MPLNWGATIGSLVVNRKDKEPQVASFPLNYLRLTLHYQVHYIRI